MKKVSRREFFSKLVKSRSGDSESLYSGDDGTSWIGKVAEFIDLGPSNKGLFVSMPDYRPDIIERLSEMLGLRFVDFRIDKLSPLKWGAGKMSLDELTSVLENYSQEENCIVLNIEALLATKTLEERRKWYNEFLDLEFSSKIIVVMTLFSEEIETKSNRHLKFAREDLPEQTILRRLLEIKDGGKKKDHPVMRL